MSTARHRHPITPRGPGADWAESGVVQLTGHADGPPLVPPGRAASLARAWARPFGVDGAALLAERAAFSGRGRNGRTSVGGGCRLLPTADGWAAVSCVRPDDPALLGAVVEHPLPDDNPWPLLGRALRSMTGELLAERAALVGVAAGPVRDPGTRTETGRPPPGTAGRVQDPLPTGPAPDGPDDPPEGPDAGAGRDVGGLLVVSFAALWAGPLCAHLLARAGARVVTVETLGRPDGARRGEPRFHALLHHGERSVVLDPGDADGRRGLRRLVDAADVVVESSRPRALRSFGLDAERCAESGTTWVSITADGRASNRVGFGDDVAAAAGLVARDGEGLPVFVGDAVADPLTGTAAAHLVRHTAPGTLLDVSMTAVVRATLGDPPGGPALRRRDGWEAGGHPVAGPRRRPLTGPAPVLGADTEALLPPASADHGT